MTTKKNSDKLNTLLGGAPRQLALLKRKGVTYLGVMVVQDPGAWASVGPAWHVPGIGVLSVGPGAARWGTSQGLAELANANTAKPTLHAVGVFLSEHPNKMFACQPDAIASIDGVADFAAAAEALEAKLVKERK